MASRLLGSGARVLALTLSALALSACAEPPKRSADPDAKLDYLIMSAEDEAADGPVDCKRYAAALENRLQHAPYRYRVERLYFCSLGTSCHVALKVDTGYGQYAADNGAFIRGHV